MEVSSTEINTCFSKLKRKAPFSHYVNKTEMQILIKLENVF